MRIVGPDTKDISQKNLLDFFELRRRVFVGEMHWQLPEVSGFDIDQYDFPYGRFVLALERGECIGGLRLSPSDVQISSEGKVYTYMLKDFADLAIETPFRPTHLFDPLPTDSSHWEMTRFVSPDLTTTKALLVHANDYLSRIGVKKILTISPVVFPRLLKSMGFQTRAISEQVVFEDGKAYVALETDVHPPSPQNSRKTTAPKVVLES